MADFEVLIHRARIKPHPNADRLDLCQIGDYLSIVRKDQFRTGDLVAFIPPGALVPEAILKAIGLWDDEKQCGKLDGKRHDRVKEKRLRGIFSEGLIYPAPEGAAIGDDVTERLAIEKYEPPVPISLQGKIENAEGKVIRYDIENIKKYPGVLRTGEPVVMTEKLHGTLFQMGIYRRGLPDEDWIVSSKGMAQKGFALIDDEGNDGNLYVKMFRAHRERLLEAFDIWLGWKGSECVDSFYILGEIYGPGVQKLQYGLKKPGLAVFDVYVGDPGKGRYLDYRHMRNVVSCGGFCMVPLAYEGEYSPEVLRELTSGKTCRVADHMREGLVVKPVKERREEHLEAGEFGYSGRVIFKSVSENYLLKTDGSEIA